MSGAPPAFEAVKLTAAEFDEVAELARKEFGLELPKGKEQLVAARLGKKMRELNLRTFREYREHVRADHTGESLLALIDALTTNHTNFFREPAHFEFLRNRIFPQWKSRGDTRIWCAASSTGEEPYSIALTAREHLGAQNLPRILATDISTRVLDAARKGLYKADRFAGGPDAWMKKHLLRGEGRSEGWYLMRPEVRAMIEFRRLNLIERLPDLGLFAVIFCRNVMIYFSRETQALVVNQLKTCLEPGGYLMVGHAESLTGINHGLEHVQAAGVPESGRGQMKQLVVGVGDGGVSRNPDAVITTYALGSCIAVMMHDPVACVGGMVHYMLPESSMSPEKSQTQPWMFADTGIARLLRGALELGADKRRLTVYAAGGAQVLDDNGVFNIGKRNCLALRKALWKAGLTAKAEETGGSVPRTVRLEVGSGRVWLQIAGQGERELAAARGPVKV